MICHFCTNEAAGKCASCGLGICPEHGGKYCRVCSGAVFSHETVTGERQEKGYLQCPPKPEMETIYIDDDGPPECYQCQGLARKICHNCHNLFCKEHAGQGDWCDRCTHSARVGTWVTAGVVAVIGGLSLVFFVLSRLVPQ